MSKGHDVYDYLSPEDRCDLREQLDQILAEHSDSTRRIDAAEERFGPSAADGDVIAKTFVRSCVRAGYGSALLAREAANHRQDVALGGKIKNKRSSGRARRRSADGQARSVQLSFWDMSWGDLETSAIGDVTLSGTYSDSAAMKFRMLALRALVPGASCAAEAAEVLGITPEAWLRAEATS